jgi:hypothetical protein
MSLDAHVTVLLHKLNQALCEIKSAYAPRCEDYEEVQVNCTHLNRGERAARSSENFPEERDRGTNRKGAWVGRGVTPTSLLTEQHAVMFHQRQVAQGPKVLLSFSYPTNLLDPPPCL